VYRQVGGRDVIQPSAGRLTTEPRRSRLRGLARRQCTTTLSSGVLSCIAQSQALVACKKGWGGARGSSYVYTHQNGSNAWVSAVGIPTVS
jgi:hypothetical protein